MPHLRTPAESLSKRHPSRFRKSAVIQEYAHIKTHHTIKSMTLVAGVFLLATALVILPSMVWASAATAHDVSASQATASGSETIQLGNIKVHGQQALLRVLQAIKVGLQQPISTDPKFANVMVCRMNLETGSHIRGHLICATNAERFQEREALSIGFLTSLGSPAGGGDAAQINGLNEALLTGAMLSNSVKSLDVTVGASAFHALMRKIPDPEGPAQNPDAPAQIIQLGSLAVRGQDQILKVLQAIKLALQQRRSDDPAVVATIVCRLHDQTGDQATTTLVCATNATLAGRTGTSVQAAAAVGNASSRSPLQPTALFRSMLLRQPGGEIRAYVNSADFLTLLQNVPLPESQASASSAINP